jgi:hypothetical protein
MSVNLVDLSGLQFRDVDGQRVPVQQTPRLSDAVRAVSRIDKMSKASRVCEELVDCERKFIDSYSELAASFADISLLEGSSSLGHISHSFDALTFEKFLHKHVKTVKICISKQYHHVFSQIKQISRYRDSVKSAVSQRDEFENQVGHRIQDVKVAEDIAEKAKIFAKNTANMFSEQSKSPLKPKNYANDVLRSQDSIAALQQRKPVPPVVESIQVSSSFSIVTKLFSAAQSVQDQLLQTASMVTSSVSSSPAILSPNDVFQAQLSSSKAIRDYYVAEDSLQASRVVLSDLVERFESDLARINYIHNQDIHSRIVEFAKLRVAASHESYELWKSFSQQLDSAMGEDSVLMPCTEIEIGKGIAESLHPPFRDLPAQHAAVVDSKFNNNMCDDNFLASTSVCVEEE